MAVVSVQLDDALASTLSSKAYGKNKSDILRSLIKTYCDSENEDGELTALKIKLKLKEKDYNEFLLIKTQIEALEVAKATKELEERLEQEKERELYRQDATNIALQIAQEKIRNG